MIMGFGKQPKAKCRERSVQLILERMNIESPKAVLMPVVHQAPIATPPTPAQMRPAVPPVREPEPINQSALTDLESQKRIAVVERLMGMNKSLIVEKDAQRVGYVYKTIDRSTGEVVRVWPQKEVATALMALADSDARAIIKGMMVDAVI